MLEKRTKLTEYFELASKGAKNIDKVLEGRFNKALDNFGLLNEEKKEEAEKRMAICLDCPFNSVHARNSKEFTEWYLEGFKNSTGKDSEVTDPYYFTNRSDKDLHCCWCSCDIDAKVLSMESNCGIEEYNEIYKMNKELKWQKK